MYIYKYVYCVHIFYTFILNEIHDIYKISLFASKNNMLEDHYRCYGNPKDKIHLGFNGIRELERIITQKVSLVDARSYRAVVQSNIT